MHNYDHGPSLFSGCGGGVGGGVGSGQSGGSPSVFLTIIKGKKDCEMGELTGKSATASSEKCEVSMRDYLS